MAASSNNTIVLLGSSSAIVDVSGNVWTITSAGQVAVGGVTDTTTDRVTELAYENGVVWQENASNLWWSKTSPNATWLPSGGTPTSPVPTAATSPNNTVIMAPTSAAIVDASGNSWTITTDGLIAVNGVVDTTTARVIELAYENGVIWQENASDLWWSKTSPSAAWLPSGGTPTSPIPVSIAASLSLTEPPTASVASSTTGLIPGVQLAETGIAANAAITINIANTVGTISMNNAGGTTISGSGTSSMSVTDTLANLNADLATLSYSAGTAAGSDELTITATSGTTSASGATTITITSPTTSPNNTIVTAGSTAAITDSNGNQWTITSLGQVAVNGVTDTTTANVIELAYEGGIIWQENTNLLWWSKTLPTDTWGPNNGTATSPIPGAVTAGITVSEPSTGTVTVGEMLHVTGVSAADTGLAANTAITLTVTDTAGAVAMTNSSGGAISGSGGGSITVTDTLVNLNADLASLTYTAGSSAGVNNLAISATGGGVTGAGTTAITTNAASGGGNGQFYVSNGQIIGPNGQQYFARGVNVLDSEMGTVSNSSAVTPLLTVLPGTNFVRLDAEDAGNGNFSGDSVAALTTFVNQLTAKGIVVEIEDHDTDSAVYSNSSSPTLGQVTDWYSSMATAFSGNPYVWLGMPNEPGNSDSANQLAIYQAIRATGNNNMVLVEYFNGNGVDPTVYPQMTNIAWDMHFYANSDSGASSSNQSDVNAALLSYVQANQTGNGIVSANGTIPVIIGEFGNSFEGNTGGSGDSNGTQVVSAVLSSTAISGYAAWVWNWPGSTGIADNLVNQDNATLTSYGQQVAAGIASGGPTADTSSTSLVTTAAATSLPSTSITIAQTQASATVSASQISVLATAGDHAVFITGSSDNLQLSGGTNTITDSGGNNTYVLPAAGNGFDAFANNILTMNDTLDLRPALAATNWNGAPATLAQYLSVADTAQGAVLSVSPTAGGVGVAIASISGAATANLTSLLAHAMT